MRECLCVICRLHILDFCLYNEMFFLFVCSCFVFLFQSYKKSSGLQTSEWSTALLKGTAIASLQYVGK